MKKKNIAAVLTFRCIEKRHLGAKNVASIFSIVKPINVHSGNVVTSLVYTE